MNEEEEQERTNTILEKLLDPLWLMAIQQQRIAEVFFFFFFFFFFYIYTKPKNMCTLYTVSNKTTTDVRGSAEQLPQDLGGTTLNLPRLGPSSRIV